MSNMENKKCQFQNCQRIANYRKLKVGNCHLKNTRIRILWISQTY